jgi:hypothetical protein
MGTIFLIAPSEGLCIWSTEDCDFLIILENPLHPPVLRAIIQAFNPLIKD